MPSDHLVSLSKFKVNFLLWVNFIFSLIKYKKQNKILLYSQLGWHLGSQQNVRKKIYKKWINENYNYCIIDINFEDKIMVKCLILFLNKIFKKNKIKLKKLFENKIPNRVLSTKETIISASWDIFLRDLHKNNDIEFLPINYYEIKNSFSKFFKNFKIDKKKYRQLIELCLFENLEIAYTEEAYEEWRNVIIFYKFKKKIYNFENIYGFIEISGNKNISFNERINNFFLIKTSHIENRFLEIAKKNLDSRTQGNYNSSSLFHTRKPNYNLRDKYNIKQIRDNAIFLFNHAFADASNKRAFKNNLFSSYYAMTIFVIEFAAKNNFPIYIKPHPTRYTFISEQKYNFSLKKALIENKKNYPDFYYEIIDGEFNNAELLKFNNLIAITGRGTVSIECGYLGIPIINMYESFGNYAFCNNYEHNMNLFNLIKDVKKNYNKSKSQSDAIKIEAVLEKLNSERLIEFTNISKETGKIKNLEKPFFSYSSKI